MTEFIGSPFADPRKVHSSLVKANKFSLWIDIERLRTTNQNEESLGMVSQKKEKFLFSHLSLEHCLEQHSDLTNIHFIEMSV